MTTQISDSSGRYFITPAQILERFLLTGSTAATYKANDKFGDFPADVMLAVKTIMERFPKESFKVLSEVVYLNKAPRKPPVLLALAAALNVEETRKDAQGLSLACIHTGTDQFLLTKFMLDLGRGKGRSFKRNVNFLYSSLDCDEKGDYFRDKLALQMIKYRNRAGWTHRDLLRVGHYKPSERNNDLFAWVTGKGPATHPLLASYEQASRVKTDRKSVV